MSAISRPVTKVDFAQLDGYGVPADGLGNLGDRYYDIGAGRWYLKRWVGNFSGFDYVSVQSMGTGAGIVVASCLFYCDGVIDGVERRVISNTDSGTGFRLSVMNCKPRALISGPRGAGFTENMVGSEMSIGWHKISMTFRVGGVDVYVDGIKTGVLNAPGVTNGASLSGGRELHIGRQLTENFKGSNFFVSIDGVTFSSLTSNEGEGLILKDSSFFRRDGVLNDGSPENFWYQSWVPMDLL